MADIKNLDWFATWQNSLCFLVAVGAGIALGPLSVDQFLLVFVCVFAASRLIVVLAEALWTHFWRRRSADA